MHCRATSRFDSNGFGESPGRRRPTARRTFATGHQRVQRPVTGSRVRGAPLASCAHWHCLQSVVPVCLPIPAPNAVYQAQLCKKAPLQQDKQVTQAFQRESHLRAMPPPPLPCPGLRPPPPPPSTRRRLLPPPPPPPPSAPSAPSRSSEVRPRGSCIKGPYNDPVDGPTDKYVSVWSRTLVQHGTRCTAQAARAQLLCNL